VVAGLMPTQTSFALLLVPTGASALVFSVACNSFVQLGVDPQMRGRILALYFMAFMGGTPVGAPLIGWVSEHLGARWGFIAGGLVCVVAAIVAGAVLARGRRVRLEVHVHPPSAQLHVAAASLPAAVAGLTEEADGEVPGEQAARDRVG
jgi:MFS family permease